MTCKPVHTEHDGNHSLTFHTSEQNNESDSFFITIAEEGLQITIYAARWEGKKKGYKKIREKGFEVTNHISLTWNELKKFIPLSEELNPPSGFPR